MKKITFLWSLLILLGWSNTQAQVGIGTITPDASAILEISATGTLAGKGLLLTPQTALDIDTNILSPVEGLLVYDTDINTFKFSNSLGEWVNLSDNTRSPAASGLTIANTAAVGIGTTLVDANATLTIDSTTQGLLLPKSDTDLANIEGLMYYNTASNEIRYYDGVLWTKLGL